MHRALLLPLLLWCACASGEELGIPDAFPGRPDAVAPSDASVDAAVDFCALAVANLVYNFETGAEGFVHGPMPEVANTGVDWTYDHWQVGSEANCASGGSCWGTNLLGNYIQCQRAYLVSPPIDVSACGTAGKDLTLSFQHNYEFWTGDYGGTTWFDGGLVEVTRDGTNWESAATVFPGTIKINPEQTYSCVEQDNFYVDGMRGYVGSSNGWVTESVTIPSALASVTFQFRFVYAAGVSSMTPDQEQSKAGTAPGWFVDDIHLEQLLM